MNSGIPDWCFEFDPPSTKKNIGQDYDLVELLWQNGQVVLNCQTNRKPSPNRSDARQPNRHDDPVARAGVSSGNACNPIPHEEMGSWIHYPVVDSFEEFRSQIFGELPSMDIDKPTKQVEQEKVVNFGQFSGSSQQHNMRNAAVPNISRGQMPPSRFQFPDPTRPVYDNSPGVSGKMNFSQLTPTLKGGETGQPSFQIGGRQGSAVLSQVDVRECSAMTVGSSRCCSNQIPNDFPDQSFASSNRVGTAGGVSAGLVKEDDCNILSLSHTEGRRMVMLEPTLTLSSGGSGSSFEATAKQCVHANTGHKRKGREGEEPECQSEALEIESAGGKKSMTRSGGSTRRSRAAEVHNLSERRRRDRINNKMKALQALIPHCNKTDKASMLDEAIEYLKSLQLQLQVMWMRGGMAPMMFPGAQHYMSSMGMTMCPPMMPAVHPNMHMPRIPMVDQSFPVAQSMSQGMFGQTPVTNPMSFQNQTVNPSVPEQFAQYMAMHNIQTPQPTKIFKFGCQGARQNQTNSQAGGNSAPYSGGATDGASG